ncbi:gastrula zinc finger protein XlCGF57.1-like [Centroberyx affinis]|uniref:gastrula zinc finger protein XlCGF57.1-like n=1 Tax=Centroberyx affinis TaxID=166261 RepID=UPI003A5C24A4
MSKVQKLRALVNQRLTAADEEIFGLFERTIAEYEEEASRSKEEIDRQRKLLDAVLHPEVRLHRADFQQLLVSEEEVPPEQQEWSPSLDQEDPEPPHIKEEQEELWTSQEGEQHQGLEEADITKFPFTAVPVKSEDDEEKPRSSQLHQSQTEENREAEPLASSSTEQMKTEADGEDCGVSEPARNLDPASHLQPISDGNTSDSSEPETEDSDDDWMETGEPQSGVDSQKNSEVLGKKDFSCSVCGKKSGNKEHLKIHMRVHTGEKPFDCSVCGKSFSLKGNLKIHMIIHTGEKPFNCSVCGKSFGYNRDLKMHMRVHTGETPLNCSVCGKSFVYEGLLKTHMRVHTGEKPFNCSVCGKGFAQKANVKQHMKVHTGEKAFNCSVCGKGFDYKGPLETHMRVHTREKPFNCSVCGKSFVYEGLLKTHMRVHTGEKPFNCSVCGKSFALKTNLKQHMKVHTGEKPFNCSVCGKSFGHKANWKRHMTVHTGEKPLIAGVGNFGEKSENLKVHNKTIPPSPVTPPSLP